MTHQIILPAPHLRPFVAEYLLLHISVPASVIIPPKPFPASPRQGLLFYARGFLTANENNGKGALVRPRTTVFGQQISRFDYQPSPDYLMVEVVFRPGMLTKFLRLPLTELTNHNVDAEAVLGPDVGCVNERVANSQSYAEMITHVETYLWQRLQQVTVDRQPLDTASQLILNRHGRVSLDEMASYACLSISQFQRRFEAQMGISPKLFARIARFSWAFQHKERNPALDWLSVAVQADYHDYQHLVRDFRQFAGVLPNTLIVEQAAAPEIRFGLDNR